MTRDYARKNRPARRSRPKSQVPAWVWLFTGCVLGGFVMFLVHLGGIKTETRATSTPAQTAAAKPQEPRTPSVPKPRFDFYKLLQESEEVVPATEPVGRPERPATTTTTAPPAPSPGAAEEFILQVGSFRSANDADRLRAQLLLLNLNAYVEQVTIRDNELWHRVLVGPFDNQSRLASARSTLISNEYNALVLKRKAQ